MIGRNARRKDEKKKGLNDQIKERRPNEKERVN